MKHNAATQRERIRQYLYYNGGMTRNELAAATMYGRHQKITVQTLCFRLDELVEIGHVIKASRRKCLETGAMNIEYRLSGPQKARITRRMTFERHKPMSAEKIAKGKEIVDRMVQKRKAGRAA